MLQGYHARLGQNSAAQQADDNDSKDAAAAAPAEDPWPSDDVLSGRTRQLFTLLAQAVVLAESQGLLMPLPGEGLALSERLLQLPPSAGHITAGEMLIDEILWQEEDQALLEELLCADEGSEDDSDSEAEDPYAAYNRGRGRGRGRRGRGRGRGRTSKAERLAAEAAAFGAMVSSVQPAVGEDEGEEGGGRRRVHKTNSRYADHVLIPVLVGDGHHGGGGGQHAEVRGGCGAQGLACWEAPTVLLV